MPAPLEPLQNHPVWDKVATLPDASSLVQVARKRQTGEYVSIKASWSSASPRKARESTPSAINLPQFLARGFDAATTGRLIRATINHMELSTSLHPHIVLHKETFLTPHYLATVTEYIEGETIEAFLEKVGGKVIEGLARFIFQQLMIAVDYCHLRGKVLRDIKLCNVLLSIAEGQLPLLKLCDFSASKDLQRDTEPNTQEGGILYAAPEVLQNANGGRYDARAADVWSCAIILYVMLFGRHPFLRDQDSALSQEQRMVVMLQRTVRGEAEYPQEIASGLSPACMDLLMRTICVDPGQRLTTRHVMAHPWFLEALPEGAGVMNQLFLADSKQLTGNEAASVQAIVQKAARSAESDELLAVQAQMMHVGAPVNGVAAGAAGTSQQGQQPSMATPLTHPQAPLAQQQQGYAIQHLGMRQNALARGLNDMDNFMAVPSGQLKSSAIEDILRQGTNNATPHMDTLLGGRNWSGRNMGELERGLMQSSSFMREFTQANEAGLITPGGLLATAPGSSRLAISTTPGDGSPARGGGGGGDGGAVASGSNDSGSGPELTSRASQHLVDPSPFLYEGPAEGVTPTGIGALQPHASFSALVGSFDFNSFNNLFSPPDSIEGGGSQMAAQSTWARICKEAGSKLSESAMMQTA